MCNLFEKHFAQGINSWNHRQIYKENRNIHKKETKDEVEGENDETYSNLLEEEKNCTYVKRSEQKKGESMEFMISTRKLIFIT